MITKNNLIRAGFIKSEIDENLELYHKEIRKDDTGKSLGLWVSILSNNNVIVTLYIVDGKELGKIPINIKYSVTSLLKLIDLLK